MLVISCHADTGFEFHSLSHEGDCYKGHLDNFVGVYAVMKAYFSGQLNNEHTRIELTYDEEVDMAGACEVLSTLNEDDVVLVVDVTATPTEKDLVIEKCKDEKMQRFLTEALGDLSYDLYEDCPDPVSCFDETDIYSQLCRFCCFIGVPCIGGDYNDGPVYCTKESVEALAMAICRLSEYYPKFGQD
ncbi:MAG: hypothetical protein JEZ07_00535 [Phycisphaerae bacterium]|nr:hypothetical protein [Phycisphaerae bacterium]